MDVIYSTRLFMLLFDSAHRKLVFHLVGCTEWIQSVERKLAMKRRHPERRSVLFGDVLGTRNTFLLLFVLCPFGSSWHSAFKQAISIQTFGVIFILCKSASASPDFFLSSFY